MASSSRRHNLSLIQLPAALPFPEDGDRAESTNLLIMAGLLVTSHHLEAIQEPTRVAPLE